jgi:hypothetical protein
LAHDVFISYSSKDKTIADAVCARLEARGIRCWIAPRDVHPGLPYAEEIIDGIQTSRVMVLVLSANANSSPHIPKEVERAVSLGIPVIPLRVENVTPGKSLDYFISSVHWLDAITPPLEQHLENLASTILAILPQSPHVVVQPPVTPTPANPLSAPPPAASTAPAAGRKPKWLVPVIVTAVVLAAGAWFFWGRQPANETREVQIIDPGTSPHTQARASASSASDPITGCWRWTNNATVVIHPDGTMVAGPFTGRWQADPGHQTYHFTWPEAVDTSQLSSDGRTLTGGNQYGFAMSATRLTFGPEISGNWRWYNGVIVTIQQDGYFTAAGITGHWQQTTPGTYALTWPKPVDTVSLSSNHRRLQGGNQYGIQLSATKLSTCGGA